MGCLCSEGPGQPNRFKGGQMRDKKGVGADAHEAIPQPSRTPVRNYGFRNRLKRLKRRIITPRSIPYFLYMPCFIVTVGILYPFFRSFYYSLTRYDLIRDPVFLGFDNYVNLFTDDPNFPQVLWNTLYYVGLGVPLGIGIAFCLPLSML